MPTLKISDTTIRQAAAILLRGGLVAFPTETVYGLGGDVINPAALAKIFEAKGRPRFDPLIVHIAAVETLETIADLSLLSPAAREKLDVLTVKFWPGPLTLILPKRQTVPDIATSGLPTVAVRLPDHEAARQLIALSTGAVAAPSANPFGYLSPTRAEHVQEMLGEKADLILDGGQTLVGLESTVLDICQPKPRILRPGAVPKEAIEALIGHVDSGITANSADTHNAAPSPGMQKSHYAPRASLFVYEHNAPGSLPDEPGSAIVFFDGASRDMWLAAERQAKPEAIAVLSETGDMLEAAARFFELLHELDRSEIKHIHAQLAPEAGLGAAINDRLRRAASR